MKKDMSTQMVCHCHRCFGYLYSYYDRSEFSLGDVLIYTVSDIPEVSAVSHNCFSTYKCKYLQKHYSIAYRSNNYKPRAITDLNGFEASVQCSLSLEELKIKGLQIITGHNNKDLAELEEIWNSLVVLSGLSDRGEFNFFGDNYIDYKRGRDGSRKIVS